MNDPANILPRHRRHSSGFSLVEAVICVALVGGVFVATIRTVGAAADAQRARATRVQGNALARQLLSEILQASYKEPVDAPAFGREGSESAADRSGWDDVDDYDGFVQTTLTRKSGTSLGAAATGWKWESAVAWVDPANPANTSGTDAGVKRVTVTVTDPRGKQTRVQGLRSSAGVYDQPSAVSTTYVSRIHLTLQIGSDGRTAVTSGVNLLNEVK
jgi:type II secretory pathway pseudopilin PulG